MAPKPTTTTEPAAGYYLVPNLRGTMNREAPDLWVHPILIDDDDLQFGGKSLSALYEEERRRRSAGAGSIAGNNSSSSSSSSDEEHDEEERRGRERVRRHYSPSKSHRK
ncbi:hypothetical protein A9K55_001975 [Cordyceps militaris]|uniref:Uncharacterized protein n=1 Tax=Cordyceps militaris TaxID=73501 RepID=A0A2H4SSK6_CORMI|nr:hypothetical protein A9K55_001975 [Cordyceps militaris]